MAGAGDARRLVRRLGKLLGKPADHPPLNWDALYPGAVVTAGAVV